MKHLQTPYPKRAPHMRLAVGPRPETGLDDWLALVSDDASYITSQIISVSGGMA
jgi:hypothetical protein